MLVKTNSQNPSIQSHTLASIQSQSLHQTQLQFHKMRDPTEFNRVSFPLPYQLQAKRTLTGARTWLVVSRTDGSRFEELEKEKIMCQTGILANDLRVIEPELSSPSAILRRERAIVVNLENIKAIVTANEVLVPNPKDPCVGSFVCDLKLKLSDFDATMGSYQAMEQSPSNMPPEESDIIPKAPPEWSIRDNYSKPLPFEFRALEICLESVYRSLEFETSTLVEEAYPAVDKFSAKTSSRNLERVKVIKGRLLALHARVQKVRDEFEHILDDDSSMAEMYLTDKLATLHSGGLAPKDELETEANTFELGDDDNAADEYKSNNLPLNIVKPNVEELETLLGSYFVQIDGILNKLSTLREYIHDTEDYINIVLNDKQNQYLHFSVIMNTANIMMNLGVVTAAFFTMGIDIGVTNDPSLAPFYEISCGTILGSVFLFAIAIVLYKRMKFLD